MCIVFIVQDQQQLCDITVRMVRKEEEASANKMRDAVKHAGEWKGQVTVLKKENKALKGELEVGFLLSSTLSLAVARSCITLSNGSISKMDSRLLKLEPSSKVDWECLLVLAVPAMTAFCMIFFGKKQVPQSDSH